MVLEFSMPLGWLGRLYRVYFTQVLPRLGGLVSGDAGAYGYLPASVDRFPAMRTDLFHTEFETILFCLFLGQIKQNTTNKNRYNGVREKEVFNHSKK